MSSSHRFHAKEKISLIMHFLILNFMDGRLLAGTCILEILVGTLQIPQEQISYISHVRHRKKGQH